MGLWQKGWEFEDTIGPLEGSDSSQADEDDSDGFHNEGAAAHGPADLKTMQDGDYVALDGAIKEIMAERGDASEVFHLAQELLAPSPAGMLAGTRRHRTGRDDARPCPNPSAHTTRGCG